MSENIRAVGQPAMCASDSIDNRLGSGVALACMMTLMNTLGDLKKKSDQLRLTREQMRGLMHWIDDNQRGVMQLAAFLRQLGGDQTAFWKQIAENARRSYGISAQELEKMLIGTFRPIEEGRPEVSDEIPY